MRFLEGLANLSLAPDYMTSRDNPSVYLKRTQYFLGLIGNPHKDFKYVHITGTAGKGTVATMVAHALSLSGEKTGLLTSPFVTSTIEKISVDGRYLSPDDFADAVEYLKPFIDKAYLDGPYGRPSYFEIIFAIALLYFRKQKCARAVLEVGCGGRFDYTNVIPPPLVSAITNIHLDHTDVIGDTLERIAYEKAGIIKRGSAFVTTEARPKLLKFFESVCKSAGATYRRVPPGLDFMHTNRLLAEAIAKELAISDKIIARALEETSLPARFEIVSQRPYVVIDGAHNAIKMKSVVASLRTLSFRKLHLIIGLSADKEPVSILREIIPLADRIFITRFGLSERKCAHPKKLYQIASRFRKRGARISLHLDAHDAFDQARKEAGPQDLLLITGSFFLAGELRKRYVPEEKVLRVRRLEYLFDRKIGYGYT